MTSVKERALVVGNKLGVKLIPRLPDVAKRLLSGGRAVTIDGNTLDPSLQMLLAAQKATGIDGLAVDDDPIATRASNSTLTRTLDERDVRVAEIRPVSIPGPAGTIPARHYRPQTGAAPAPLLVFFHGGGWVFGDLDSHDSACRLISRDAGTHVLAVDYRLAPEHPAPAAADDAYAAYRWAREHAVDLGADPRRVAGGRASAGGNPAAGATPLARDAGGPTPS
ncbi:MAG: alpha/beta hydrolase, partial [Mycobacterium sp.]|nr:alpha/beta hydrolase [Mycobacterium sp.]